MVSDRLNLGQSAELLLAITKPMQFSEEPTQDLANERAQRAMMQALAGAVRAVRLSDLLEDRGRPSHPPPCTWDRVVALLITTNDLEYYTMATELYCGSLRDMSHDEEPTVFPLGEAL